MNGKFDIRIPVFVLFLKPITSQIWQEIIWFSRKNCAAIPLNSRND